MCACKKITAGEHTTLISQIMSTMDQLLAVQGGQWLGSILSRDAYKLLVSAISVGGRVDAPVHRRHL